MSKRIVIALGGNALGNTAAEQLRLVTETAKSIVDLIAAGNEVVVAHGNGPQVGMINLGLSTAAEAGAIKADMLRRGGYTISEVAYSVGFSTPGYFSKCFREMFGVNPSDF